MTDHEFEILFPDNYEYRVQIHRLEYEITLLNISSLCHMANQQFEYLASNKNIKDSLPKNSKYKNPSVVNGTGTVEKR